MAGIGRGVPAGFAGASAAMGAGSGLWPGMGSSGRRPRGAFLWPQAAVAALNLDVPGEEGQSAPFVALDLLAAKAVADVGIFVAPDGTPMTVDADNQLVSLSGDRAPMAGTGVAASAGAPASGVVTRPGPELPMVSTSDAPDSRAPGQPGAVVSQPTTAAGMSAAEAASASDAGAGREAARVAEDSATMATELGMSIPEAAAIVTTAGPRGVPREFKALYVALSRSSSGRSLSTAVRAARALALARSIDQGGASSARARAAAAWAVMPMVVPGQTPPVASGSWSAGWSPSDQTMLSELASAGVDLSFITANNSGQVSEYRATQTIAAGTESGEAVRGGYPQVFLRPGAGAVRLGPDGQPPRSDAGESSDTAPPIVQLVPSALASWLGDGAGGDSAAGGAEMATRGVALGRAGESLRSLVAPALESGRGDGKPGTGTSRGRGALSRVPTAAPPLVQTGSTAPVSEARINQAAMRQMINAAKNRRSSGDVSIPPWFEKAARQMFASGDGISLAEMTLVATAPAHEIAASPKSASASPASTPEARGGVENEGAQAAPDVEAMALEVYAEIVRLMEISRERNGEPWR